MRASASHIGFIALSAGCFLLPRLVGSTREGGGFDHRFPSRHFPAPRSGVANSFGSPLNDGSVCGTEVSKRRLHARGDWNRDGRPRDAASSGHGYRAPKLLSVPRSGYANRFGHPSNARTFAAAVAPVTRRGIGFLPGQW